VRFETIDVINPPITVIDKRSTKKPSKSHHLKKPIEPTPEPPKEEIIERTIETPVLKKEPQEIIKEAPKVVLKKSKRRKKL
jgi:hypothetical protein